jgi:hypothetical protein
MNSVRSFHETRSVRVVELDVTVFEERTNQISLKS